MKTRACALVTLSSLALWALAWSAPLKVEFVEGKYQIDVKIGGKLFTSYIHTPDPSKPMLDPKIIQAKPVLFPLVSPSGVTVTRGYPFVDVPGEDKDHPHHQGLFFTVDDAGSTQNKFWGNSKDPLPVIRHSKVRQMKGGDGKGTLATTSFWIDKNDKPILEEEREMVFMILDPQSYAIDFTIALKATQDDVQFADTKEGMFCIRVAQWLTEKAGGRYLNSEGEELEKGVWGKRANWVRLQGEKDGKKVAIAILSHPSGVNSPTYWHARGYGCFSVNPLGQLDFMKGNKVADPKPFNLLIKKGEKALFKYRVIFSDGEMDKAKTEAAYKAFVH